MSRYFIELSDSPADRLYLEDSQVDLSAPCANVGYMIYAVADLQGSFCNLFPSTEAREDYINEEGIDDLVCRTETMRDAYTAWIWEDTGSRDIELCSCLCDVNMVWLDFS